MAITRRPLLLVIGAVALLPRWAAAQQSVVTGRVTSDAEVPLTYAEVRIPELSLGALTTDGALVLKGWAVCRSPTSSIAVLLDGDRIGEAEPGMERPDVGNLLPSLPHARQSGFVIERRTGKSLQGERLVTLRVTCCCKWWHIVCAGACVKSIPWHVWAAMNSRSFRPPLTALRT